MRGATPCVRDEALGGDLFDVDGGDADGVPIAVAILRRRLLSRRSRAAQPTSVC
jgi:hypothetical protein